MTDEQLEKAIVNAKTMAGSDRQGRTFGVVDMGGSYQVWVANPKTPNDYRYTTGEVAPVDEIDDLLS